MAETRRVYFSDWAGSGREGMARDFSIEAAALDGVEVLFADYTYQDYSGSAYVLFAKGETLYEVVGGHCSCYGLEGQWEPEATTVEALSMRRFAEVPEPDRSALLDAIRQFAAPSSGSVPHG